MRLLLVRHGDPDYGRDTLTEKGKREARLLACMAEELNFGEVWASPMGRAGATASYALERTGKIARVAEWLHEFMTPTDINLSAELPLAYPDTQKEGDKYPIRDIVWEMVPSYMTKHPEYVTGDEWRRSEVARCGKLVQRYDWVTTSLDNLFAEHGYVREGGCYRVAKGSKETLTFFAHFGVICVILSHLWNVSPFVLWHGLAIHPCSVTELLTEEYEQGIAWFRALRIGDLSHLYRGGEKPSFGGGRYCELYSDREDV